MQNNQSSLLSKFLCQMTGEEFLQLNELARKDAVEPSSGQPTTHAYGIGELAKLIGCSPSTVYSLKRQGILDDAIVSNIGRKIIFDVEKARALADNFQRTAREERHGR